MDITKMKKLEDLKTELSTMKERNNELKKRNIDPMIDESLKEFLRSFGNYFNEKGFEVTENQNSVLAKYEGLVFTAKRKGSEEVEVLKNNEEVFTVFAYHRTPSTSGYYTKSENELDNEIASVERAIESAQKLRDSLEEPQIRLGYDPDPNRKDFENCQSLLNDMFN